MPIVCCNLGWEKSVGAVAGASLKFELLHKARKFEEHLRSQASDPLLRNHFASKQPFYKKQGAGGMGTKPFRYQETTNVALCCLIPQMRNTSIATKSRTCGVFLHANKVFWIASHYFRSEFMNSNEFHARRRVGRKEYTWLPTKFVCYTRLDENINFSRFRKCRVLLYTTKIFWIPGVYFRAKFKNFNEFLRPKKK